MKKTMLRTTALLMSLVCLLALAACGKIDTKKAVTYRDFSASRAVFRYLCCLEKTNYLYELYGYSPDSTSSRSLQDNEAIWSATDADGKTLGDTLKEDVLNSVKEMLYLEEVARAAGYTLSAEQKSRIQNQFNSLLKSYRDKKEFNENMASYGIDYDQMLDYTYHQNLSYQGRQLLFGEGGTHRVPDSDAEGFWRSTRVRVQYVFVNLKNKTYPNGKTVVLPESERAARQELAEELYARLESGETFETVLSYAEGDAAGAVLAKDGFGDEAAEKAFWAAKIGTLEKVTTEKGVYLFRRLELPKEIPEDELGAVRSALEGERLTSLVEKESASFGIDEDFLASLDIAAMPHVV